MTTTSTRTAVVLIVFTTALSIGSRSQAGDVLSDVRQLYANAAYEQALALLDTATSTATIEDARSVLEYRALCLVALDRTTDATRAAEALVRLDPTSRPGSKDISPRLAALLREARLRLAPAIVREHYAHARDEFNARSFDAAADDLTLVLALFDDESLMLASQPALADLQTVAQGFLELARRNAPPSTASSDDAPRVAAAPTVAPPVPIQQRIPPMPDRIRGMVPPDHEGAIEVLVGVDGTVTEARMVTPVHWAFDPELLAAARTWKYRPATSNGVPVAYRAIVRIKVAR